VIEQHMALTQKTRALSTVLQSNNLIIHAKIGEVSFVNNREGLEYTPETIDVIKSRINLIFDKIEASIQDKFTPLENLWEAKKMYNAIFGTGQLDLERGEDGSETVTKIRILDGNLTTLEQVFKNSFMWNNIKLSSPSFDKINRFDNIDGECHESLSYEPIHPVVASFRKKNSRLKRVKCNSFVGNRILASNNTTVIINDTGSSTGMQKIARYFLLKENSSSKIVHILTFSTPEIKEKFYNEFQFGTVPTLKASELMPEVKEWYKSNKIGAPKREGGGTGGGVRMMKYINVETGYVEESEVPIRDIEDGGVFLQIGSERMSVIMSDKRCRAWVDVSGGISTIAKYMDLGVTRIYIINNQTGNAKWFNQAVEDEVWTNLWDVITEDELDEVDWATLTKTEFFNNISHIGYKTAKKINHRITDKSSPFLAICEIASDESFPQNLAVIRSFQQLGYWDKNIKKNNLETGPITHSLDTYYPLLRRVSISTSWGYDDNTIKHSVDYINAMDTMSILNSEIQEIA
jgi:hypothetical protein